MTALNKFVDQVIKDNDIDYKSVQKDYPKNCLPDKFKPSSSEKAKTALVEKIDLTTYEPAARMVAFKIQHSNLIPWIKTLQLLYYEHYGSSQDYNVLWKDSPDNWETGSSPKTICISLESKTTTTLLYKITVFINTGLVQVQGNRKDDFVQRDFPALTKILAKVIKCNLRTDTCSDPNATKDMKEKQQNEENSADHTQPKVIVDEKSADHTHPKIIVDDDMADGQNVTSNKTANDNDMNDLEIVNFKMKPENLIEKIESNFTLALHKISQQQENRIKAIEEFYKKSIENNNNKFSEMLTTITKLLNPKQEVENIKSKLSAIEKENNELKLKILEMKSDSVLQEETLKSRVETQELKHNIQKENSEQNIKQLTKTIETLETKLVEKKEKMEELEGVNKKMALAMEHKDEEINQLKFSVRREEHQDSGFTLVGKTQKPKTITQRSKPHVLLLGTSTTKSINPDLISAKYTVEKRMAMTLEETATEVSNISEKPDIIVFHSLSNDVKTKPIDKCVSQLKEIIENTQQQFSDTKVIISLPLPRGDDETLNNKAQMLSLTIKDRFRSIKNIITCDNTNLSFKGKPIERFYVSDLVHLTTKGTAMLAANIRDCIDSVLGFPHRLDSKHDNRDERSRSSDYGYGQQNSYRGRGYNSRYMHRGRGQDRYTYNSQGRGFNQY